LAEPVIIHERLLPGRWMLQRSTGWQMRRVLRCYSAKFICVGL